MLKAIIFDMDGVIIDSEPAHARAALSVFSSHGINVDIVTVLLEVQQKICAKMLLNVLALI